jgi:predicted secreted Zn-dependent protease
MGWRITAPIAVAAVLLVGADNIARAEIIHKTVERAYRVHGKNARDVAAYMRDRPFRGDDGPAIANIRARYSYDFKTKKQENSCRVDRFRLRVDFTMTLPHATQQSSFDRKTKRRWQSLQQFIRRHEGVHKKIYLTCARQMEREVKKLQPKSCQSLNRQIGRIVGEAKKICEDKQRAFDRRELRRLTNHSFFKQARAERDRSRRKLTPGVRRDNDGRLLFYVSE